MASSFKSQALPSKVQRFDENFKQSDEHSEILGNNINKFASILKTACQANFGKWNTIIANAITAREMDPRSIDSWKLCAKAALVGGDVDASLDCLYEALNMDFNDEEACVILQGLVDDHLNKMLKVLT